MNSTRVPIKVAKAGLIAIIIAGLTFLLTAQLQVYLGEGDIFSLSPASLPELGLLMILPALFVTLSYPAWKGWKMYLAAPLPTALGVYLVLLTLEPINALLVSGVIFLNMVAHIKTSEIMGEMVTKFTFPQMIMKPTIKGYFLSISIAAAMMVLLSPGATETTIADRLTDFAVQPIRTVFNGDLVPGNLLDQELIGDQIEEEVEIKIKEAIRPYRHLLNVFLAVVVFLAMQGFSALIYPLYSILVIPFFWLFTKTGFIRTEVIQVEKDQLHF